ncbi:unnamed protein product [Leuciscus chuanchicus]
MSLSKRWGSEGLRLTGSQFEIERSRRSLCDLLSLTMLNVPGPCCSALPSSVTLARHTPRVNQELSHSTKPPCESLPVYPACSLLPSSVCHVVVDRETLGVQTKWEILVVPVEWETCRASKRCLEF